MQRHISKVTSVCFYHLRRLRQIRNYVSQTVMAQLVTSLVITCIGYCNSILNCRSTCMQTGATATSAKRGRSTGAESGSASAHQSRNTTSGADSIEHRGTWLGTGSRVSRRTANKKLTKLYWPSRKRSPKRLIVLLEPKSRGARPKEISGAKRRTGTPTFKFVPAPLNTTAALASC